jgi:hypothetical protein
MTISLGSANLGDEIEWVLATKERKELNMTSKFLLLYGADGDASGIGVGRTGPLILYQDFRNA